LHDFVPKVALLTFSDFPDYFLHPPMSDPVTIIIIKATPTTRPMDTVKDSVA
jgi:hypothetical protein